MPHSTACHTQFNKSPTARSDNPQHPLTPASFAAAKLTNQGPKKLPRSHAKEKYFESFSSLFWIAMLLTLLSSATNFGSAKTARIVCLRVFLLIIFYSVASCRSTSFGLRFSILSTVSIETSCRYRFVPLDPYN